MLSCVMGGATLRSRYLCCLFIVWGLLVWIGLDIVNSLIAGLILALLLFFFVIALEPVIAAMLHDDKPPDENL